MKHILNVQDGMEKRIKTACDACHILITLDEIRQCDTSDLNRLFMTCVKKGISASWLLFHRGRMWYVENNFWTLNGRPLSFDFASVN